MVIPNVQNHQIRKRRQDAQRQIAGAQFQGVLNSVLWQTIVNGCKDEDGEIEGVPQLTVARGVLAEIPKNFALNLQFNPKADTFTISAVLVKPKSNIVLADGSNAEIGETE